jgi:phosphotransferase system HPr (HPr) family protein
MLVGVASMFESEIMVRCGRRIASAKSMLGVITLGAGRDAKLYVSARGHDAQRAIRAIKEKFASERAGSERLQGVPTKSSPVSTGRLKPEELVSTTFKLRAAPLVITACLVGDFNDWNPQVTPMAKKEGQFTKCLKLAPGQYHYKYILDGAWHVDPDAPFAVSGLGTTNNVISVKAQ